MKKPSINDANLSRWSHGEVIRDIENAGKSMANYCYDESRLNKI